MRPTKFQVGARSRTRVGLPRLGLRCAAGLPGRISSRQCGPARRARRRTDGRSGRGASAALAAAGLLAERDTTPYAGLGEPPAVRLIGAGPVGYQLARLLVASGLGDLHVYDDEPPDLVLYPAAGVLASRSEALRSALPTPSPRSRRSATGRSQKRSRWISRSSACDQPELDRVITDHLVRNDQPHLLVRSPGQRSVRRTAGACWSDVLPAVRGPGPHAMRIHTGRLVLRQLVVASALRSSRCCLAGRPRLRRLRRWRSCTGRCPESAERRSRLSWPDFVTRMRRWPAHPNCGCGWLSQTEWGHE